MRRRFIILSLVILALLTSCGKTKVIPVKKMTAIYADMLMADQWLQRNSTLRTKADTTLFYEPIFRKYGYTFKDYDASVTYYVDNYEKYMKILRDAAQILKDKAAILEKIQSREDQMASEFHYEIRDFEGDSLLWKDSTVFWPLKVKLDTSVVDTLR